MGRWVDVVENQRAKWKKQNDRGKVKNIRRAELPWVRLLGLFKHPPAEARWATVLHAAEPSKGHI